MATDYLKLKIILFYSVFLKTWWEDLEVIPSFPNISTQHVNQSHERWINAQNNAQVISKHPRDGVSDSLRSGDHVALRCIDLVCSCA